MLPAGAAALVADGHVGFTGGRQGAGIGCCGWSRGDSELAVLVVAPVGHVVK